MITKNGPKPKLTHYRKILEKKAEEVRSSMSAQKAAQVVSRLDVPSDEGDLSQQHHEEWIFLNRNTIEMKLADLRRYSIRKQFTIRFRLRNGMECVITDTGIAQVPALKAPPDFNLEEELASASEFLLEPSAPSDKKTAAKSRSITRDEL